MFTEDARYTFLQNIEAPLKPWKLWRQECRERFKAIFSASPVYALEELRKGNLLIEENI